jgi:hypothetical protein
MTTVASSWWPFGRGSTAAQSAEAKKSEIRNLQRQAFINQNKLPDDETTKKIYDYIEELRSIKTDRFNNISFASIDDEDEERAYRNNIRRAATLINLVKEHAFLNPVYGPICCQEIQQSFIDSLFIDSKLHNPLIWFAVQKIGALRELALSDKNLASLVLPLFQDSNIILTDSKVAGSALIALEDIQSKWAPHITLTRKVYYCIDAWGIRTYDTSQVIFHRAQQLIDTLDPLRFAKKHPARHAFMSASLRLANNSKLKVDDRAGRGKFVPDTSTAAGTSAGASAAAPAITDDSDDEGGVKGAGSLNSSHPGADAGAYDDMPALEFVGSDNDGEGADPEESKEGEE